MPKTVTLKPRFGAKHIAYMQAAQAATISVAEGAVRAGKTVDNVAVFAHLIEMGVPDRIHLATGSTSANAKLNIGDCNGFGLEHIFRGRCKWTKYKGNEALQISSHGRTYIVIFSGAAKADSFKKIRGNSYGMWIATEINLHHENTIKEAFNRQLAARVRKVFWDLNPGSPANWIYKNYIDKFPEQLGAKYCYAHFTIRDNATITAERLAEIEAQYDKQSVWYRRDILGERCDAEGLIYDMFNPEYHVLHSVPDTEGDYYITSDFGIQNATVFLLLRKERNRNRWIVLNEYYYSGRDNHRQLTVQELAQGMEDILPRDSEQRIIEPRQVIIDPSAAALIVELRKRGYHTRGADNAVLDGIADVSTMLRQNNIAVMSSCRGLIDEFSVYAWDTKAAERGEDAPIKSNDHALDALRYFVKTLRLVRRM